MEEVEIKIKISKKETERLRGRLLSLGATCEEKLVEKDIYFTVAHRNFITTKECLRIRATNKKHLVLTYKGPTTGPMLKKKQFWKKEIDIPLCCSKEKMGNLLILLGCKKIAEVRKEREKFIFKKQIITLDKVEKIGWFLEVEEVARNKKERIAALENNLGLLKKLGLGDKDIITEPYRDLVLRKTA